MRLFIIKRINTICEKHPKLREYLIALKNFYIQHMRLLIIIGVISFIIACVEIPREIYKAVMNYNYYHNLGTRDYWPVHDYYGNNVNIFEYEKYLEDCGASNIIKGFYYKDNGNTAICYDFHVGLK